MSSFSAAFTAAMVFEAAPADMVPEGLSEQILASVGAKVIVLKMKDSRRLLAAMDMPPQIDDRFDLRVHCLMSGPLGGDLQIGALVAEEQLDLLFTVFERLGTGLVLQDEALNVRRANGSAAR